MVSPSMSEKTERDVNSNVTVIEPDAEINIVRDRSTSLRWANATTFFEFSYFFLSLVFSFIFIDSSFIYLTSPFLVLIHTQLVPSLLNLSPPYPLPPLPIHARTYIRSQCHTSSPTHTYGQIWLRKSLGFSGDKQPDRLIHHGKLGMKLHYVMWIDVMWCDVVWCGVVWIDAIWCDVNWCELMRCELNWIELMWYDVMWCDVTWCDVNWCDVIWYDMM